MSAGDKLMCSEIRYKHGLKDMTEGKETQQRRKREQVCLVAGASFCRSSRGWEERSQEKEEKTGPKDRENNRKGREKWRERK